MPMKTQIEPVQVWPETAVELVIATNHFGPPPAYTWELFSAEGKRLKGGMTRMSEAEWFAWPAGDEPSDTDYQLSSICRVLGLTRIV